MSRDFVLPIWAQWITGIASFLAAVLYIIHTLQPQLPSQLSQSLATPHSASGAVTENVLSSAHTAVEPQAAAPVKEEVPKPAVAAARTTEPAKAAKPALSGRSFQLAVELYDIKLGDGGGAYFGFLSYQSELTGGGVIPDMQYFEVSDRSMLDGATHVVEGYQLKVLPGISQPRIKRNLDAISFVPDVVFSYLVFLRLELLAPDGSQIASYLLQPGSDIQQESNSLPGVVKVDARGWPNEDQREWRAPEGSPKDRDYYRYIYSHGGNVKLTIDFL